MFKIRLCGVFIITFFILAKISFCSEGNPQELEPIVISKQKQFFLNIYSTDADNDQAFNYQSSIENLSNLPVDLQSRALKSSIQADFSLRGGTFQQILILLNGQRINDPQTAHHNSDIPFTKEDIKKTEVIPGASSSLFGADAIGGAINFALSVPKEKKFVWEFGAGNNRNGYGLFSLSDKFKELGFRVSVEDAQSKGFREDTDYKKFTSSLSTNYDFAQGSWENNFGYQEKNFGAYDFYTPDKGYLSREQTRTYLLSSGLNLSHENLLIKPSFLWRRHYDKFVLDKTQLRSNSVNQHRTDMFTPSIYLQKEIGVLGKVGLGAEWGQERITSTNLGRHVREHKSILLDDSTALGEKWEIGSSLRWDDFSDFGKVYTGSLSAKFKFTFAAAFNFGISRSMRVPSFTELYYSDSTTIGNDGLAAEKSWNYETGFEYKQEGFSTGLCLFLRQEKEMIDWVRSDPTQKWQAKNFTRGNVFGVEYVLHNKFNRLFGLDANYIYTDKNTDSQGYLYKYGPNYAQHLVNTTFNLVLPFGQQEIGFNYKKRPGRRGWLLMNSGFNYNLNRNAKIFLHAENILNVEYQDIAGIPQPGRYIEAGLRLQW
ncbi:MAG: TonB-dependent receptor [Candidatus Omnitrophica bacterium]|nr:TonB-dependent receptor [Candidatus Omnitrophota bacterium]MBU1923134.1 TonB-dependent receptor [Candidatus Omnitrophota bacterium]